MSWKSSLIKKLTKKIDYLLDFSYISNNIFVKMNIIHRCIIVEKSIDPKVNEEFPVGDEIEVPDFWWKMGYLPSMSGSSTGLDLKKVERLPLQSIEL